ncbi:YcaO-like family protein [Kitasatospora sp. NPDC088391]|uniref:YcaO-like family protein n=1 Tax=Kitasatospora sp. NPDC088391 TaxID=3364074 RepID=UPI003818D7A7
MSAVGLPEAGEVTGMSAELTDRPRHRDGGPVGAVGLPDAADPVEADGAAAVDGVDGVDGVAGIPAELAERLRAVAVRVGARLAVFAGHRPEAESAVLRRCAEAGEALLPVRVWPGEVEVGPRWSAGGPDGCPLCAATAQLRGRAVPPGSARLRAAGGLLAGAVEQLHRAADVLAHWTPGGGEVLVVTRTGAAVQRVRRVTGCPSCGAPPLGDPAVGSVPPVLLDEDLRPVAADTTGLDRLTEHCVDARYGPVLGLQQVADSPGALVAALHSRSGEHAETAGFGRGRQVAGAARTAILERLERAGSEAVLAREPVRASYAELGGLALDPRRLGRLSAEQLAHPSCRVDPFTPDAELLWAEAASWEDGRRVLVPVEAASYHVTPRPGAGLRWGRVLFESSNGCALGSSRDEAVIHALLEVIERDAFLMSWWRGAPLPRIDWRSVTDPLSRQLHARMRQAGYRVHLLRVDGGVPVPVVWALAFDPRSPGRFSLTAAGAHPDPVRAVRGALTELAPLVLGRLVARDDGAARRLRADPWRVSTLADHVRWYSVPEAAPVFEPFLSGGARPLSEVFADCVWGRRPAAAPAGQPVGGLGELAYGLRELLRAAGMPEVLVVDQGGWEHVRVGLHAVRAIVPGAVPMCFGFAHQRVLGLPRLAAAVAGVEEGPLADRLTVHPFP